MYFIVLIGTLCLLQGSGQNIAITDQAGYTAESSAMLDVHSQSKGFLVPRLTNAEKMAISNPAKGLMVFQTDGSSGFYYNRGSAESPDWELLSGGSSSLWIRNATGTGTLLANPADSVGVGNTEPVEKLDVSGNLALDYYQPLILFQEDSLDAARIQHFLPPDVGYLHLQAWDGMNFETVGLVVRSPAQDVGIGTTTPVFKLDVAGTTRTNGFILSKPAENGYILTADSTGYGTWQPPASHIAGSGTARYIPRFSDADTIGNSTLYQNEAGNVGVGNTNPSAKLDVSGKLRVRDNINANGHWLSGDGDSEGVFVNSSGNVGIGMNNPASRLSSNGMVESVAGGYKFPDGTVQESAATGELIAPQDAAEKRWLIGMKVDMVPGPWNYPPECPECFKVYDLKWSLIIPRDSITGLQNGARRHRVVTVTKDIDLKTPFLMRTLVGDANPEFDWINFVFYKPDPMHPGIYMPYYKLTLQGARIVGVTDQVVYTGNDEYAHMERYSFIYQVIVGYDYEGSEGWDDEWPGQK